MPVLMGGPLSKTQRGRGEYPNTNRHTTSMWNFAVTHTNLNGILLHLQTAKPYADCRPKILLQASIHCMVIEPSFIIMLYALISIS